MTPTSATGRARGAIARCLSGRRACRAGFTLVELLMTVAIIGLAAGAVVLSVPDPRPSVAEDAERFAARLSRAREEAVLTNRPVAVETTAAGYDFSSFDGAEWSPLTDGPFGPEPWSDGLTVSPAESVRLVFDPTGVAEPATVILSRDGQASRVQVDGAGEVTIDG